MVIETKHPTLCTVMWGIVQIVWLFLDIIAMWGVLFVMGLAPWGIGGTSLAYMGIRWLVCSLRNHSVVEIEFAGNEKDNDKEGR